jgi:hypothetical protein
VRGRSISRPAERETGPLSVHAAGARSARVTAGAARAGLGRSIARRGGHSEHRELFLEPAPVTTRARHPSRPCHQFGDHEGFVGPTSPASRQVPATPGSQHFLGIGAGAGDRTHMSLAAHKILSPVRLPVSPLRRPVHDTRLTVVRPRAGGESGTPSRPEPTADKRRRPAPDEQDGRRFGDRLELQRREIERHAVEGRHAAVVAHAVLEPELDQKRP